ncbi:hypothetical protein P692DRAFT_20779382, partial [Suillus brevipes Sb2]
MARSSPTKHVFLMTGPTSASHSRWCPPIRAVQATPQYYSHPQDAHRPPLLSPATWSNPQVCRPPTHRGLLRLNPATTYLPLLSTRPRVPLPKCGRPSPTIPHVLSCLSFFCFP